MYRKLILNDVKKSRLITVTIAAFVLLAALLTSLAATLLVNLLGAIDGLMVQAKTPHYMQMHSGDLDFDRLEEFAHSQANVEDFQVLEFLNVDGSQVALGENTLAGSIQDNGLSTQSDSFDYLLGMDGEVIHPADGEIYVPIYYMREGLAQLGDAVTIHGVPFTVAGFLRDSMMNSAIISSKRFLVSEEGFEQVRALGKLEYLIQFRFTDPASAASFESAYLAAGLEANGPSAITSSLIRLSNAMSDGIMIAVLILISALVIVVTFLCIRFTLLAKIEDDYREIGVLKAIGLRVSSIKKLYLVKYGAIAAAASLLGFLLSLALQGPFMENIRLFMGEGGGALLGTLCGIAGAVLIFLVIVLYVNGVLRRFRKISAAQAIRFGAPQDKTKAARLFKLSKSRLSANLFLGIKDVLSRKGLYVTMLLVLIISAFLLVVPQNIYTTISARNFMTNMGIGMCDARFDVQQTDDILGKTAEIDAHLGQDAGVSRHAVLISRMFAMPLRDGTTAQLKVELGDHTAFPVQYSGGRAPAGEDEIALSTSNADDLEKNLGDSLTLVVDGAEKTLTVCGLYSDITNGGLTAKAVFPTTQPDVMWATIPVEFSDKAITDAKIDEYRALYPFAKVSNIDDYIDQTYGSTIAAIRMASYAAIAATVLLAILVTLLFMKMLIAKDRYSIAVLKSVGFTSAGIRRQYLTRSAVVLVLGVAVGIVLANTLGEVVGTGLIASFGASTFHFEVDPLFAYLFSPLLIAACVFLATLLGVSDIRKLKVSEYIKE